jgi:o-succinylbenzoate---CoA ligase
VIRELKKCSQSFMQISCPLHTAAAKTPRAVAIKGARRILTYGELDELAIKSMVALQAHSIKAADPVAILANNSIEYIALLFAIARLAAVAVPLNVRLGTRELRRQLDLLNTKMMIADATHQSVANSLGRESIVLDSLAIDMVVADTTAAQLNLDSDFCVVFTSGSSGEPKGVVLSLGNVYDNALGSNANLPLLPTDCWHLSLPLFHVGGLGIVFRSVLAGAQISVAREFDSQDINTLIDRGEISHLSLVPTMLLHLLKSRNFSPLPRSIKAILLGGAPLPPRLREEIEKLELPAITSYGMTETASQVAATALDDSRDKLSTSGRALGHAELKIDRESVGEILVRGKSVCRRILGAESDCVDAAGWLRTGDIGSLDAHGYLTVLGRKDDMFISGGENIFPQEISEFAEQFSDVVAATVIAVPDEEWGARPLMFVELKAGGSLSEKDLLEFLATGLARFKLPKRIVILKELPRTTLGKVDRPALARLAAGLTA